MLGGKARFGVFASRNIPRDAEVESRQDIRSGRPLQLYDRPVQREKREFGLEGSGRLQARERFLSFVQWIRGEEVTEGSADELVSGGVEEAAVAFVNVHIDAVIVRDENAVEG